MKFCDIIQLSVSSSYVFKIVTLILHHSVPEFSDPYRNACIGEFWLLQYFSIDVPWDIVM